MLTIQTQNIKPSKYQISFLDKKKFSKIHLIFFTSGKYTIFDKLIKYLKSDKITFEDFSKYCKYLFKSELLDSLNDLQYYFKEYYLNLYKIKINEDVLDELEDRFLFVLSIYDYLIKEFPDIEIFYKNYFDIYFYKKKISIQNIEYIKKKFEDTKQINNYLINSCYDYYNNYIIKTHPTYLFTVFFEDFLNFLRTIIYLQSFLLNDLVSLNYININLSFNKLILDTIKLYKKEGLDFQLKDTKTSSIKSKEYLKKSIYIFEIEVKQLFLRKKLKQYISSSKKLK